MKELIILRHAKSDWGNEGLKDIDRHLNERGYEDAYIQSNWMVKEKTLPDAIVSSMAIRALSTALLFHRAFGFGKEKLRLEERIYEGTVKTLLQVIETLDDTLNTVMLVGHNPGLTDLANHYAGEMYFENIPTCGIVSLKIESESWKNISKKKSTLHYYQFPKSYRIKN